MCELWEFCRGSTYASFAGAAQVVGAVVLRQMMSCVSYMSLAGPKAAVRHALTELGQLYAIRKLWKLRKVSSCGFTLNA